MALLHDLFASSVPFVFAAQLLGNAIGDRPKVFPFAEGHFFFREVDLQYLLERAIPVREKLEHEFVLRERDGLAVLVRNGGLGYSQNRKNPL